MDIPSLKNNLPFLEKISKYPNIAQKIVDLYKIKPNNINLLLSLLEVIYQYDINYDSITNSLIPAFLDPSNIFLNNLNNEQLGKDELLILIFKLTNISKRVNDLIDVETFDKNDVVNY